MKYYKLLLLSLVVFAFGCTEEVSPKKKSYFTLSQIKLPNGRIIETSEATTNFNLSDLKASREFYFLLGNGGENEITDIKLETDNPSFIISPSTISKISGTNDNSGTFIPLISLGILHGIQINGVGAANILDLGINTATLTITGKTIENGQPIELKSEFTFSVNAKVMDVTLLSNDQEINLANVIGYCSGCEFDSGLPSIPVYNFDPSNFKIKNSGNVDIKIKFTNLSSVENISAVDLTPGQTKSIPIPAPTESNYYSIVLNIDGNGTVTDRTRIKQGVDGKGYIIIQHE